MNYTNLNRLPRLKIIILALNVKTLTSVSTEGSGKTIPSGGKPSCEASTAVFRFIIIVRFLSVYLFI